MANALTQKDLISIVQGAIEDGQNPTVKIGTYAREKKTCLKTVPDSTNKIYKQFYQAKAWPSAQYIILEINDKEAIDNAECIRKWEILAKRQNCTQYLILEMAKGNWKMFDGYGKVIAKNNDEIIDYFAHFGSHQKNDGYYQKIFFGTPGSGKSHKVSAIVNGHDTFRITFHPDTDYSSFVGCFKPITKGSFNLSDTGIDEKELLEAFKKSSNYKNETKARYLYEGLIHKLDIDRLGLDSNSIANKLKKQGFANCAYTTELNLMFSIYDWLAKEDRLKANSISYEFMPQAFTNAYVKAWQSESPVYLVIEEINRGNCSQIFGDLFQLLDRDDKGYSEYRVKADTDLKNYLESVLGVGHDGIRNGELQLPANLFILATMNTSDQSLFPMDSAFKRRWSWEYIPIDALNPKSQFVITIGNKEYEWSKFLIAANDRIKDVSESEDKQMGNFFIKDDIGKDEFVSKVMFYLWSEVCKDEYRARSFFHYKDGNNDEFSFNELFQKDENGAPKDVALLQGFMSYLGVKEL